MLRTTAVLACMFFVGSTPLLACGPKSDDGFVPNRGDGAPPEPTEQVSFTDPCPASDFMHPTKLRFQALPADAGAEEAGTTEAGAAEAGTEETSLDAGPSAFSSCPLKEVDVSFELTSSPVYTQGTLDSVAGDRGEAHVVLPTGAVLTLADGKTLQRTPMVVTRNDGYSESWTAGHRPGVIAVDRAGTAIALEADNRGWRARTVTTGEEVALPDLNGSQGENNVTTAVGPSSGDAFVFLAEAHKLLRRRGTTWESLAVPDQSAAFALGPDDRPYFATRGFIVDDAGAKITIPYVGRVVGASPVEVGSFGVSPAGALFAEHVDESLQVRWLPSDHSEPFYVNLGGREPTCTAQTNPCGGSCDEPYAFVPNGGYAVMTDAQNRIWLAYVWVNATRTISTVYHSSSGGISIPVIGTIGGGSSCNVSISLKPNTAEIVLGRLEGAPPALVNVARIPTPTQGLERNANASPASLLSAANLHASFRDGKLHITRVRNDATGNPTLRLQHVIVDVP